jgi:NTE family protein
MKGEKYCLVLSGGGTKGVYHIGVWKALKELGVEVEGFVGASIGAIIAAFLAQGSDEELENLGMSLGIDSILEIPDGLAGEGSTRLVSDTLDAAADLIWSAIEHRGLDTSPLRDLLASKLNEGRIRTLGKDLGIVTVNLSDLKPTELFLDRIPDGRLIDYVMASAAFPGFKSPEIGGKKFVDGGLYDNIPYAMAKKRGYRRIIVSDMSGAGRNRRPDIEGTQTVYIKNSLEMGGIFDFDKSFLDRFRLLGYLDTLRTFGVLDGYLYFIEPDENAERRHAAQYYSSSDIMPERMKFERKLLLAQMECAASALEVDRIKKHTYKSLSREIEQKRASEEEKLSSHLKNAKESPAALAKALRQTVADKVFDSCPYYYWRLAEELLPRSAGRVVHKALSRIFQDLPVAMIYFDQQFAPDEGGRPCTTLK